MRMFEEGSSPFKRNPSFLCKYYFARTFFFRVLCLCFLLLPNSFDSARSTKMSKLTFLVLLGVALVFAQQPTKPTWPSEFSSSILAQDNFGNTRFFRWFYDYTDLLERMDGMVMWHGEMYFAISIMDHSIGTAYDMFFMEDEVTCISRNINKTMNEPDFSMFNYAGQSIVLYDVCYHWILNDNSGGYFLQLWDRTDDREIRRIDVVNENNGYEENWTFMEMDEGTQDPNLFVVPAMIAPVCNPIGK